jgi:hypothetical protein
VQVRPASLQGAGAAMLGSQPGQWQVRTGGGQRGVWDECKGGNDGGRGQPEATTLTLAALGPWRAPVLANGHLLSVFHALRVFKSRFSSPLSPPPPQGWTARLTWG